MLYAIFMALLLVGDTPSIRLPALTKAVEPMPGPPLPARLTVDRLYVIDSDVPVIVLTSPAGLVMVAEDVGPLRIRGLFADGTKTETRNFAGKFVYTVEATLTGRVELIVVPVGAKAASDVIRRSIDVDAGGAPAPGPTTPTRLVVVVVEETAEAVAGRGAMFSDAAVVARMKDKGHRWRVVDKDVVGADGQPPTDVKRFLDQARGKPYPSLYLIDEKGKARFAGPAPTTASALLELITVNGG